MSTLTRSKFRFAKRSPASLTIALLAWIVTGCQTTGPNDAQADNEAAQSRRRLTPAGRHLAELASQENGLAMNKWVIHDDPRRIARAMISLADRDVLDVAKRRTLQRNGFRFVRVKRGQLDTFLRALGGATMKVDVWHGQIHNWRVVHDVSTPVGGQPVGIDGRMRQFGAGRFECQARSWIVQMEDGPQVLFELVPGYHKPRPRNLQHLLDQKKEKRERFTSMHLKRRLNPNYAYILTAESPGINWSDLANQSNGSQSTQPASGDESPNASNDTEQSPPEPKYSTPSFGPTYSAPPTIGEFMLYPPSATPPKRGLLVFVPHVGDELRPGPPLDPTGRRADAVEDEPGQDDAGPSANAGESPS